MNMNNLLIRAVSKYRRMAAKYLSCRMVPMKISTSIISFSFDDAPRTAFTHGDEILNTYGAAATFYVSLGMLGSDSPSGPIAYVDDLRRALEKGHELGCHTFDHKNSWETKPELFVQSVLKNRDALSRILPDASFTTLAYPICEPRPATKKAVGKLFRCCRGGAQTFNVGTTDLNLLKAFFLRNYDTIDTVKRLIDRNAEARGWLIFATHDIDDNPSLYGCSKKFFKGVVAHAANSGSLFLPVGKACEQLQIGGEKATEYDRKPV
jgi:peptidoglycan/xylan/chitin deacetylase (PgdA/CDA1 family)